MDENVKELIKLQESVSHLKETVTEMKRDFSKLGDELDERSEEIKDTFYMAETTRKRVDEICEDIHRRLDVIERFQDKEELCYSKQSDSKYKIIHVAIQAIVYMAGIVFAFFMGASNK